MINVVSYLRKTSDMTEVDVNNAFKVMEEWSLKAGYEVIDRFLEENSESCDRFAEAFGRMMCKGDCFKIVMYSDCGITEEQHILLNVMNKMGFAPLVMFDHGNIRYKRPKLLREKNKRWENPSEPKEPSPYAIIYARQYGEEFKKDLNAQIKALKNYASENKITVLKEITDLTDGKDFYRQSICLLLGMLYAHQEIGHVIVLDIDRLSVDMVDEGHPLETLRRMRIKVDSLALPFFDSRTTHTNLLWKSLSY